MPLKSAIKSVYSLSLAGKLAILYAITSFAVLLLASGLLYWSLLNHLQQEHQKLLTTKIIRLRQYFACSSELNQTLRELIDAEHHHSQITHSSSIHPGVPHHIYVQIFDADHRFLLESKRIERLPKDISFPKADREDMAAIAVSRARLDQRAYLLASAWAIAEENGVKHKLLIQAYLELAEDENLLVDFQKTLAAVLFFGVLASAFTGFWVTRRGLRPLRQVTETIEKITVQQLNERLDPSLWPSEIALLAKAFDAMLMRLDQSFDRLSQFSADLAHELRTPVNNLMGEAEVILSKTRSPEEYRLVLESNMEECRRIARMIDELLFLARAEDPKTEIKRQWLNLDNEFQTLKDYFEFIAADKSVDLVFKADHIRLYADSRLLRRVLSNLISNALRYTPEKGIIQVLAAIEADNAITIEVQDNGAGIDAALLPQIFDRFFRADKSRHNENQGSGLGLAIVKSIMELHGGSVTMDSQKGCGTQVKLVFPSLS